MLSEKIDDNPFDAGGMYCVQIPLYIIKPEIDAVTSAARFTVWCEDLPNLASNLQFEFEAYSVPKENWFSAIDDSFVLVSLGAGRNWLEVHHASTD